MPMGRPLRRTLSPQIRDRLNGSGNSGTSSGVSNMPQNGGGGGGGGSVVFAVEKAYNEQNVGQYNDKHVSSLTSLTSDFSTTGSNPDNLFSIAKLPLVLPLPYFRIVGGRGASMDRLPQKSSRGMFWKREIMHLVLCLVLGVVMGFASLSLSGLPSSSRRDEAPRDVALVNGFVSNLRREGFSSQGLGISQDSANAVSRGGELGENVASRVRQEVGAHNSRQLQIEQLKSSSLQQLAPGLNHTLDPERKLLIIVTPTYNRPFQSYYLTRLAHTLRLVPPPLLWLVVEMPSQTLETAQVLMHTGIMYRHLVCKTNLTQVKDRVVHQRNFALEHIEKHQLNGIVYFADDDNVYSLEVFEEMRKIRRFGTWPVAILAEEKAKTLLEGPVCDKERVIGWHTVEKNKNLRRFHAEMSGFAFNSTILWDTVNWRHRSGQPVRHVETVGAGLQESAFVEQLVEDEDQMLGLPSGCNKIMVWHLHAEAPERNRPYAWLEAGALRDHRKSWNAQEIGRSKIG